MEIVIPDELYELIWEIGERIDTDNQLTQLAEEAAELSQAALKYRRAIQTARWEENISPTPKTLNDAYDSLVLTKELVSNDVMLNKAKRWLDRLKHYRDEEGEND